MLKKLFKKKDEKIKKFGDDAYIGINSARYNAVLTEEILGIVRSQQEAIKNLNDNVNKLHELIEEGKRSE